MNLQFWLKWLSIEPKDPGSKPSNDLDQELYFVRDQCCHLAAYERTPLNRFQIGNILLPLMWTYDGLHPCSCFKTNCLSFGTTVANVIKLFLGGGIPKLLISPDLDIWENWCGKQLKTLPFLLRLNLESDVPV